MGKEAITLVVAAALLLCLASMGLPWSSLGHRRFKLGDRVPLYASKVGPYRNPSETYQYFYLPFCSPDNVNTKKESFGEVLNGDHLVDSPYELQFRIGNDSKLACKKILTKHEVVQFRNAVAKDYFYEMYFDDLPIWGSLGRVTREYKAGPRKLNYFLYNNIRFNILYNNDSVIESSVYIDDASIIDITEDKEIEVEFSYTVKWSETSIPFERRMEKYMPSSLTYYLQFHLLLTLSSCAVVLFLTIFLATILMRVLKNDFVKYARDDYFSDEQEETGWKNIHADVFRFPKNKSLFAACLGSGTQLLVLSIFIFILAFLGVFYPYNRGNLSTALIVIYALTSGIAGYTATSFYCQFEGTNWIRNLVLTGCLSYGPLFLTFVFLNSVAVVYGVITAVPWGNFVLIFIIWMVVASPLLVLGGIVARNRRTEFQAPCRSTKCPRDIPPLPWYRGIIPQMAMTGLLPFGSIYFEIYYIFQSLWGHNLYTMYGILFLVFIILLIATAFATVALTYFQLASEDHLWWWRSFLCGGCTALFIYGYCFYYYAGSGMSGFIQTSFLFVYMACICYGFFLMLGTVGFYASLFFVRHIYQSIKCE